MGLDWMDWMDRGEGRKGLGDDGAETVTGGI